MNSTKINKVYNKYIIPFELPLDYKFTEICKSVDSKVYSDGKWVRRDVRDSSDRRLDNADYDLYEFLINEFSSLKSESDENKQGCFWKYQSINEDALLELTFKETSTAVPITITLENMGLYIFQTGIGMLWYSTDIRCDEQLDYNRMETFQHIFKELNDELHIRYWIDNCISISSSKAINGDICEAIHNLLFKKDKNLFAEMNSLDKMVPFSLGNWLAEKLDFLNVTYFNGSKNNYPKDLLAFYSRECLKKEFAFLSNGTETENEKIKNSKNEWLSYLDQLTVQPDYAGLFPAMCPNKALIFSYVYFSADEDIPDAMLPDRINMAYNLTNGYDKKILMSNSIKNSVMNPFHDVLWYTTKEGCGYYAWGKDNNFFYNNIAPYRIVANYFLLYIKVLYHSYSLLHFSNLLSKEDISPDLDKYLLFKGASGIDKDIYEKLSSLRTRINLFLLKSTVTSVSHIHHHNEFYLYNERQLYIKDDIRSVSIGLDVLEQLLKSQLEKEETKNDAQMQKGMSRILALITVMTLASVLNDGHGFIQALRDGELLDGDMIFIAFVGCLLVFGLYDFYKIIKK